MKSLLKRNLMRQYLNEVKCLLPVFRMEEKIYLQKIENEMIDILESNEFPEPSSLEDYHRFFGEPSEIIHQYYSGIDMASYAFSINIKKTIKHVFICVFGLIFAAIILLNLILWQEHLSVVHSEAVFKTTEIIEEDFK